MRPANACVPCRVGKRRCQQVGDGACQQCISRRLTCSLGAASSSAQPPPSPPQVPPSAPASAVGDEVLHLVDLYFRYVHNQPHTLFHEPSFRDSVVRGTVSEVVLLSMLSQGVRFAESPEIRSRKEEYTTLAKKALKDDIEHSCIENIQACILIGNTCMADTGDGDAESIYFTIANRMAQVLNLGVVKDADDGVTREVKLRLWWTCFIIDTWSSAGVNLSRQFRPKHRRRPRLPMDEVVFYNMKPGDADISDADWEMGIWGHMVELVEIYVKVQNLHIYLSEWDDWDEAAIESSIQSLDRELGTFERNLPAQMQWSLPNLRYHAGRGTGSVFVAFHIGLQHYYTLLFYPYLDRRRPSQRGGETYAERCKAHAGVVCDILRASREQDGAAVLYNIIGHLTAVSSSVLLHTYMFGSADELPEAKARLESNFQSLVQLRTYWPSIEFMINRLVVFQNHCIESVTNNTHRYDKWMIRFLLAHALTMDEKTEDPSPAWAGFVEGMEWVENVHLERSRITSGIIKNLQNNT